MGMKIFFSACIFLIFNITALSANNFSEPKVIKLKKDEQKKILVKYNQKEKLFKFRWTLFANSALVVFRSYDKIVAQNVLYLREKNKSFKFYLTPNNRSFADGPYVLVRFKEFDAQAGEAVFELLLSDKKSQISLEDL